MLANDVGRARRLLERHQPKSGEADLRGWEWRYLWQQSRNGALATLTRHSARVGVLSFSHDSRLLAIGHWDGRIEVWDVQARALRSTLRTSGTFGAVCFSPNEHLLAYTAGGGRIVVHDLATGTNKFLLTAHGGEARRLSFSLDGARLACLSADAVQVFSLVDGSIVFRRFDGFTGDAEFGRARFSPDGASLFATRNKSFGTVNDLIVGVLDPSAGGSAGDAGRCAVGSTCVRRTSTAVFLGLGGCGCRRVAGLDGSVLARPEADDVAAWTAPRPGATSLPTGQAGTHFSLGVCSLICVHLCPSVVKKPFVKAFYCMRASGLRPAFYQVPLRPRTEP